MCKLFAISADEEYVINDYLKRFYRDSNEHPNGWGLALMGKDYSCVEKEPVQATKSDYLSHRLSQDIRAKNAFAHIRYATIGNVEYKNCHPFTKRDATGRLWTLIHNGTIFDYEPTYRYVSLQSGDTDSERVLLYLTDQMSRQAAIDSSSEKRFEIMDSIVCGMSKGNKLNLIVFDGKYTYVHTNYAQSLYSLSKDGAVLFSTSPLSDEEWLPVPMTTLMVYKGSKIVFKGTNHKNAYIDNEENIKYLYQAFSSL